MANFDSSTTSSWVVQKYGGTSLGKFPKNIIEIIVSTSKAQRVAIICSARSSRTKNEGTTTRLLRAEVAASNYGPGSDFQTIVSEIKDDHLLAANDINSLVLRKHYEGAVHAECQSLSKILESVREIEEISPKAENKIISKGEKLACQYLAALLEDRGVPAQYVDLSDVVKRYNISTADMSEHQIFAALAKAFSQEILACEDKVPVLTGYFGNLAGGLLKTVGRGYSDLSAALVAIGIGANELQIWKEVDGIFTADPRKVLTAQLVPFVSPSEAAELTFYGSEVINPNTMEQIISAGIPIRIKNVTNPSGQGTYILPDSVKVIPSPTKPKSLSRSPIIEGDSIMPKRPTAVTIKRSVIVLNLCSNRRTRAHGFLARVFQILDKNHLSVDLIASSEVHISLALHSEHPMVSGPDDELGGEDFIIDDERLKKAYDELEELGSVDIVTDMTIISLVGQRLKRMTGIAGRFFGILGESGINIEMISQGASEIVISCLVADRDADKALNVVHTNLFNFID